MVLAGCAAVYAPTGASDISPRASLSVADRPTREHADCKELYAATNSEAQGADVTVAAEHAGLAKQEGSCS